MAQSTVYKPAKSIDKHLDSKLIEKAYSFAVECHKTQKRHSGDPYISHPVAVADILLNLKLDTSCLLYTSPSPRDRQKSRMPSSA